ncbi:hypothetical protein BC332_12894 [Capsicum chinense]|nr:hypothetical protein BC332_12894 [Capsicum chinense]
MGDFLIQEVNIRLSLREDIQWLQDELLFMQSFLKDAEEKKSGDQRVRQWVSEINSIANDIVSILKTYGFESVKGDDDRFASHLKACTCICRNETKFYKFGKEIQSLMQRIMDISHKRETYGIRDINKAGEGPSYNNETLEMLERMTERDLESHLRHLLEEQKYLMVVDDVWHRESWESLKRAFPNSKNGSRVIITTHKEDVAERADNKGFVHRLRFLSQEESWDLFCRKLLAVRAIVSAMERLAKDIVNKCGGLPLAIVVLSGLLSHKRGLEEWQMVKDHLWQNIRDDSIEISYILSLSYNDLSTVLKKYFLYFGVFQNIKWHAVYGQAQRYLSLDLSKLKLRSIMFFDPDSKLILGGRIEKLPLSDPFPNSITMMVLQNSKLMEDPMPFLGKLPNLRNLELVAAYRGKQITCSDNSFGQLKFLHLDDLHNLERWDLVISAMPLIKEGEFGVIHTANNIPLTAYGIGSIRLRNHHRVIKTLIDVRYVPDLKKNIISVGTLDSKGLKVVTGNGLMKIYSDALVVMKAIQKNNNLYHYHGSTIIGTTTVTSSVDKEAEVTRLWHMRLAHAGGKSLKILSDQEFLKGAKSGNLEFCEHCVKGKQTRVKFGTTIHNTKGILDYEHSDVWGASKTPSLGGKHYFITFVYDFSRRVWVYTMKTKDEVLGIFVK